MLSSLLWAPVRISMHIYLKSSVSVCFWYRLQEINFCSSLSCVVWNPFSTILVNTDSVPEYSLDTKSPIMAHKYVSSSLKIGVAFGVWGGSLKIGQISLRIFSQIKCYTILVRSRQSTQFVRTMPFCRWITYNSTSSVTSVPVRTSRTVLTISKSPIFLM